MSTIDMNRMLADMQRIAAQAKQSSSQASSVLDPQQSTLPAQDFSSLLKQAVDGVNTMQKTSSSLKKSFELGEKGVDLPEVMVASQKASVAFSAMVEVRNKLLKAYQDVMSMPV